jgi:hypothetical protein
VTYVSLLGVRMVNVSFELGVVAEADELLNSIPATDTRRAADRATANVR